MAVTIARAGRPTMGTARVGPALAPFGGCRGPGWATKTRERETVDEKARYDAWLLLAALALVLSVSTPAPANAAQGAEAGGETSPWRLPIALADDKLRIEWAEKAKLAVGGLFQGDWGYIKEDAFVTPSGWEGEVRRARIDIQAEALDRIFFRFEYDFSGTRGRLVEREIDYKDLYLGVRGLGPLGTFMVGYMKEPYSLQHLTYAGDRVFMEEALSTVFTPGRNFGLLLQNHHFDQRVTWAFGGFQNVTDDSGFFGEKGDWDVALRLTGLPVEARGLARRRLGRPQTGLPAARRAANVRGAFRPRHAPRLVGRSVLLLDDVWTTGATLRECARALRRGGARRIVAFSLARVSDDFDADPAPGL